MVRELPEGWTVNNLSDIALIVMGQSPPGRSYNKEKKGLPLLNGASDFDGKNLKPVQYTTEPNKLSQKGDLLLCIRATIGNVTISNREYCLGRGVAAIRIFNNEISTNYLSILLEGKLRMLTSSAKGSTIKGIKKRDLEDLQFKFPSLSTQKKIVAILEKAEELKQLREKANKWTGEFLQSVFLEMFGDPVKNPKGWEIITLEQGCKEIYRYPTFYGFEYADSGVPVVRIGNILFNGCLDPIISNYVLIDSKISERFPRTILNINDIVMAVRGDGSTAKRIGIVKSMNLVGANISPNLLCFKANEKVLHAIYLFDLLISCRGQELLQRWVTRTAKKTITARDIKKIRIPRPPMKLQNKFATIVEKVEQMKGEQEQSKEQIDNLVKSLMQKAFKGELTK